MQPTIIQLDEDATYFIKLPNGEDFTRQFYAQNIIRDPQIIAEIIERNYLYQDRTHG